MRFWILLALICCLSPLPLTALLNENGDFQLWISDSIRKKFSKDYQAELMTEYRWGNDAKQLYFFYFQMNVAIRFNDWLDLIPGYRHIYRLNTTTKEFDRVYNPIMAFIAHYEKEGWRFEDRNRFEIVIAEVINPTVYDYRNRVSIFPPWKWTQARLQPYVEEEFFWRNRLGISQNRFIVGAKIEFSEHYVGSIYYLLRHQLIADLWKRHNIMGLKFAAKF